MNQDEFRQLMDRIQFDPLETLDMMTEEELRESYSKIPKAVIHPLPETTAPVAVGPPDAKAFCNMPSICNGCGQSRQPHELMPGHSACVRCFYKHDESPKTTALAELAKTIEAMSDAGFNEMMNHRYKKGGPYDHVFADQKR